jgi:hypothetical protein
MDGPLKPVGTWAEKVLGETYRIVRRLGEGGMGTVYEARHVRLPLRFAVKVLRRLEGANKGELAARFRREAELTCRLRHRHIVDVVDYNTTPEGEPYIVMEFLEGETLADRIARRGGGLTLGEAVTIARQVAAALSAAHLRSVIHRDLKPQNVFLCRHDDRDDYVKVVDFGISKLVGSDEKLTGENTVLGTPAYIAPEQVLGKNAALDSRTDQFALGAMVYEMLTGQLAFAGDSAIKVFYKIVHEEPPPLASQAPGLPPALGDVLWRALAKDPEKRYPDVARFIEALEAAARDAVDEGWADIATSRPVRLGDTADRDAQAAADAAASAAAPPDREIPREALAATLPPDLAPVRDTTTTMSAAEILPPPPSPRPRRGLLLVGGGLAVGLVAGALLLMGRDPRTSTRSVPPPAAKPAAPAPRPDGGATHPPAVQLAPDSGPRQPPGGWIMRPALDTPGRARPRRHAGRRRPDAGTRRQAHAPRIDARPPARGVVPTGPPTKPGAPVRPPAKRDWIMRPSFD